MKKYYLLLFSVCISFGFLGCNSNSSDNLNISSPDNRIRVSFKLINGKAYYSVEKENQPIINNSKLGFIFKDGESLNDDFIIKNRSQSSFDETWEQVGGGK